MHAKLGANSIILIVCAAMTGCATSRSEIKLGSPAINSTGAAASYGRIAVIRSVKDERTFEQAPRDPSTPSLGFEGAEQASAELRARAIGRKRNGYGKAMGDVLLESGQTVEGIVRDNLAAALQDAGYQVAAQEAAGPSALVIDVHVKQFWAWFKPGFWAITLSANIATDLELSGAASPTTVSVHAEDKRQMATDGAWMEIVRKALDDYRVQARTKMSPLP